MSEEAVEKKTKIVDSQTVNVTLKFDVESGEEAYVLERMNKTLAKLVGFKMEFPNSSEESDDWCNITLSKLDVISDSE